MPGPVTPFPCRLNEALPPRLTAGDALSLSVRDAALAVGTFVFFSLTSLRKAPVRYVIGGTLSGSTLTPSVAVDATGTASFTVPSVTTAAWAPGRYRWVAFSQDGSGNRNELAQGEIAIAPNPLAATPADSRSRNERILANLYALMEGNSLDDVQMYKIGGRELTKLPLKDLLTQIGVYEARVRNERARKGERVPSKNVKMRFG